MKFFSSAVIAFSLLSTTALAGVIPARAVAPVQKRAVVGLDQAITIVTDLTEAVKVYTGQINATSAETNPLDLVAVAAASTEISGLVTKITSTISEYTAKIGTPDAEKRDLIPRQAGGPDVLANLIVTLLVEISSALNNALTIIGIAGFLNGVLGGLVGALSALLLALVPVVDNLLELVRRLLDSLLIGLSLALAGLLI